MIDEDIMEKIIPIPDEEEEMENIEAELAEADFPITNFKKGGVFYHISQRWSPTNLTQGAEFPANRQNNTMMM